MKKKKVEILVITLHQFRWAASKSFPNLLENEKFSGYYLHALNILYLRGHHSLHKWLYISTSDQQISGYLCYVTVNISSFSVKVTLYKTAKITASCPKVI